MRPVSWRNGVALAIPLILAACGGNNDNAGSNATIAPAGAITGLCNALAQIASGEQTGFAGLRDRPIGTNAWAGRIVPEGFRSCSVEGPARYRAEYVCWGKDASGGDGSQLQSAFDTLSKAVDTCLAGQASTRRYHRSQTFDFTGGERVALWRDMAGGPGPGFSLKIEENLSEAGHYSIRLGTMTLR